MAERRSGQPRSGKPGASGGHGVANLVGGGPSLVGPVGAMRARDVSRPRDSDYDRAEKTVVVRRRPPDAPPLPPLAAASPLPDAALQSSDGESAPADS